MSSSGLRWAGVMMMEPLRFLAVFQKLLETVRCEAFPGYKKGGPLIYQWNYHGTPRDSPVKPYLES
jgi:hypothetical protein